MQRSLAFLLLACALAAVTGRQLQQASFKSVGEALTQTGQLSTLLAAIKAAGLTVPDNAAWTVFAPSDKAFNDDDIKDYTGLTAAQLLQPANKAALTQLLQFHIVPSGAVKSSQLRNGQRVGTALAGAPAHKIEIKRNGKVEVYPGGQDDNAGDVLVADIMAGRSVVHIIDEVLIPPSLRRSGRKGGDRKDDDWEDDD